MPDKPFFIYFAPGATHAPHHVPEGVDRQVQGQVRPGLGQAARADLRAPEGARRHPAECRADQAARRDPRLGRRCRTSCKPVLAPRDGGLRRLPRAHRPSRRPAVDALEDLEILDDTLIYYIIGDNGASAEGTLNGTLQRDGTLNGMAGPRDAGVPASSSSTTSADPNAYNHYAVGWAHAMDTPYQWTKQVASHWGGTRNGTIVHWPNGIKAKGEVRSQFHHVIDVAPTDARGGGPAAADLRQRRAAGADRGRQHALLVQRREGRRAARDAVLRDVLQPRHLPQGLDGGDPARHARGCRQRTSARFDDDVWELYDTNTDWTQAHDLAKENPTSSPSSSGCS